MNAESRARRAWREPESPRCVLWGFGLGEVKYPGGGWGRRGCDPGRKVRAERYLGSET